MLSPTESLLGVVQGVLGPSLLSNSEWSDTMQREFAGRLQKVCPRSPAAVLPMLCRQCQVQPGAPQMGSAFCMPAAAAVWSQACVGQDRMPQMCGGCWTMCPLRLSAVPFAAADEVMG